MDLDRIRELIDLMKENDLTEIRIKDGQTRLLLRRGVPAGGQAVVGAAGLGGIPGQAGPGPSQGPTQNTGQAGTREPATQQELDEQAGLVAIKSPMVGTFYTAPAPDAEPYVRVGDRVNPDTVVCIIEAMKVMNEIKAEVTGTIERISAENAQPVEFDQPMFMVRPD